MPEQPSLKELRILNETTEFRFSKDASTFSLISRGFQTSVGLTEADIENYSNLYLTAPGNGTLTARLATRVEDINTSADIAPSFDPKADALKVSVIAQTPVESAWRVLMIADQPGRLVESNIVLNLNPPSAIADTSWIKPGKTLWDWWNATRPNGKNNDIAKYCIDFCARHQIEYMLLDGGWSKVLPKRPGDVGYSFRGPMDLTKSIPAIDVPMLVEYARSKNVRISRRVQARRDAPHLPQRAHARRRHGRGVQHLERARYSPAQRDARLHPHVGGAHGLHAWRVR